MELKIAFFIIVISVSNVFATPSYSQVAQVSLNMENKSLEQVMDEIESQSEFYFIFNQKQIDVNRVVSIQEDNKLITDILPELFKGTNVNYAILDRKILLTTDPLENNLLATASVTEPQQNRITGTVTDKNGPIPGANVVVTGTTQGTLTDTDGKYSIEVPPGSKSLTFSFIGMEPQEITIGTLTQINVTMSESAISLEEVVVIGYGTTKRKDYPGSVSSVKMENSPVSLIPTLNPLESLKGNVAGLNIGVTNTAGGEPSMLIRGQNSIKGSNSPLIILDGVIYLGSLSDINPNDIATYDVLKDALSSAAYGSRSANGVISITTKMGKTSKPTITFSASTAFQQWQNRPEMMKGAQFIELVNARNSYAAGSTYWLQQQEVDNMNAGKETVWLDKASRTGAIQNYQVAVSGASNGVTYYLSTSYDNDKGIIVNDDFNRISVMGKVNTKITSWLQIGADANFSKRDYSGITPNLRSAAVMSPYGVEYRDELGNLEKYPITQGSGFVNPLWGVNDGTRDNKDIRNSYRLNSYVLLTAPWIKGLTYRINFQNNLDRQETGDFYHEGYYIGEGAVTNTQRYAISTVKNYLTQANGSLDGNSTYSYVFDNILNFNRTFNKHYIDMTIVATRDYSKYEDKTMTGSDFSANGNSVLSYWGLQKATTQKVVLDANERSNIGYLGRLNYYYNDKYFLTGSFRHDGASVFGANQKWGNFGAVGLAWRISNEEFLKNFEPLNNLKLKLSWGQNGNQGIGPYSTLARVSNGVSSGIRYEISNTGSQIFYGLAQSNMGNSNLGWELTEKWNTGFESVWLSNRLFVDFDIYTSKTTNEIYTPTIPSMNGFSSITSSLGEVHNHGVELTVKTVNIQNNDWNWNTSLTFWLNRNKLVHLDRQDLNNDGIEDDKITDGMFIGKPLNAIYGYVQDGIVQLTDVDYKAMPGATTIDGYPKYKDINGDGQITSADRQILGYAQENFRLNLSNSVSYKNFELYVMVTGIFGGGGYYKKSNTLAYLSSTGDGFCSNMSYRPYWTPDNLSNVYPAAFFFGDAGKFLGLQSRSFVRIQNISLSYTLKGLMNRYKFNSIKVFCTANNPFIFTNWVGGDPEMGTVLLSSDSPVASTYSLGVNISF